MCSVAGALGGDASEDSGFIIVFFCFFYLASAKVKVRSAETSALATSSHFSKKTKTNAQQQLSVSPRCGETSTQDQFSHTLTVED